MAGNETTVLFKSLAAVDAAQDDARAVQGDVARGPSQGPGFRRIRIRVFPNQFAVSRVKSLNDVARIGQVHDAVMDQRCYLITAFSHRHHPGKL